MKLLAISLLAFAATTSIAEAKCYDVDGVITSTPVPVDFTGSGCFHDYPDGISGSCITADLLPFPFYLEIEGSGNASFEGVSELTAVPVTTQAPPPFAAEAFTPLIYLDGPRADLQNFTSQAILTTRFRGMRGTLYTQDSGVITQLFVPVNENEFEETENGGFVGQIVRIVGGEGDFAGATGIIGVAGREVNLLDPDAGSAATYTGYFCVP